MHRRSFLGVLAGVAFACCTRLVPDLAPRHVPGWEVGDVIEVSGFATEHFNCRCVLRMVTPEGFHVGWMQVPAVPKGRLTDGV